MSSFKAPPSDTISISTRPGIHTILCPGAKISPDALSREYTRAYLEVNSRSTRQEKKLEFTPLFTTEEATELTALEYNLLDLYNNMEAKFVVGELDIHDDAVWQKYLDDAAQMGAARALEIQKTGYERSMALLEN